MSYLLIVEQIDCLPRAIELSEETITSALEATEVVVADIREASFGQSLFLIDQDSSAIYRTYVDASGKLKTAPEKESFERLGYNTGYEYFEGPQTAEMSNDS